MGYRDNAVTVIELFVKNEKYLQGEVDIKWMCRDMQIKCIKIGNELLQANWNPLLQLHLVFFY